MLGKTLNRIQMRSIAGGNGLRPYCDEEVLNCATQCHRLCVCMPLSETFWCSTY
ncbi:hypothetical protein LX64_00852 [Chitinophaga skermanii]|uniref:Uncharacterized protein n=1 Tax=Chitinophaga skermanii TaxID=331697 RepID=A0A327QW87_9BACT|nr:hypothetical protein LX64_00852 [Chitinophaga skermanii]